MRHKKVEAFSLVELAIALVIIGLLIGAVLKGQELLESARLKSVMSQINQYRLATNTFVDRYGALPGDYDQASSYIKSHLRDGNNNGKIEGLGLSASGGRYGHEATSFWAHLAAADLIPDPGTKGGAKSGAITFKHGAPATKLGGGITISYAPQPGLAGHWFIVGHKNGPSGDAALLTPLQALSITKKLDTDDPFSGHVQIRNGSQGIANAGSQSLCIKSNKLLNTENKQPSCVLYARL